MPDNAENCSFLYRILHIFHIFFLWEFHGQQDTSFWDVLCLNKPELQENIALSYNQALVGKTVNVICDEADGRNGVGRTFADAPEIDNIVYFTGNKRLKTGEIYQVLITEAETFDLYGKLC